MQQETWSYGAEGARVKLPMFTRFSLWAVQYYRAGCYGTDCVYCPEELCECAQCDTEGLNLPSTLSGNLFPLYMQYAAPSG